MTVEVPDILAGPLRDFGDTPRERAMACPRVAYLTKASSTPLAAAGGTQTASALRTPALPTAFSAVTRSDAAITSAAPPRSGRPSSETPG